MPANVRPSWVEVSAEGRANEVATGPRKRDGELTVRLSVRENGGVLDLLRVVACGSSDGKYVTVTVIDRRTSKVLYQETFTQ